MKCYFPGRKSFGLTPTSHSNYPTTQTNSVATATVTSSYNSGSNVPTRLRPQMGKTDLTPNVPHNMPWDENVDLDFLLGDSVNSTASDSNVNTQCNISTTLQYSTASVNNIPRLRTNGVVLPHMPRAASATCLNQAQLTNPSVVQFPTNPYQQTGLNFSRSDNDLQTDGASSLCLSEVKVSTIKVKGMNPESLRKEICKGENDESSEAEGTSCSESPPSNNQKDIGEGSLRRSTPSMEKGENVDEVTNLLSGLEIKESDSKGKKICWRIKSMMVLNLSIFSLASRDKCLGSWCQSPGVRVHVRIGVGCLNKNFNSGHNFLTRTDRAFILQMCIPCDKTFHLVPYFLTSWPWPWSLTYFWKTLTLVITFLPELIELSYCTCVLFKIRPFIWCRNVWPRDIDLEVWTTFDKI